MYHQTNNLPFTLRGSPIPLGAVLYRTGANFSILSRHAHAVSLLLFDSTDPDGARIEIKLDPKVNKTGDIWHVWVEDIKEFQIYGYRVDGPYEPEQGHRFNKNKLLLDPYARALSGNFKWDLAKARGYDTGSPEKDMSFSETDNASFIPKCILITPGFESAGIPLNIHFRDSIIYELHVRGFTYHNSSGVTNKGTFSGLTKKIPYLKDLGITAVELMPIHEFDQYENRNINPATGEKLKNYWGYSTIAFFAPKGTYSSSGTMGEQYAECREMIKKFHEAGIEVILDVVFNHTAELDETGPTLSFRGIDNSLYYILKENKRFYRNFSGCGNTVNCNHTIVKDFIIDCLKFWVIEMNVDGFRFDLASILGRDSQGNLLSNQSLLERIEEDPILRDSKIIAEAWDVSGNYAGQFPGRWAEWNGKFRDDVRRFWRGDANTAGYFATRLMGSADLYSEIHKSPLNSINYITCHDGFTLNDLVSFNKKHNEVNGENNKDGEENNLSWNYGFEGLNADKETEHVRNRQIKNFIATLFLSQGVPMLLSGDEFRRTQHGNNNAYCQDNELSWIDWSLLDKHNDIFRFCREIIRFRKEQAILRRDSFFTGLSGKTDNSPDVTWHGKHIMKPDWNIDSHFIACVLNGKYAENGEKRSSDIYMAFNASKDRTYLEIPDAPSGNQWHVKIDTWNDSPDDIYEEGKETPLNGKKYIINPLAVVVMTA